MLPHISRRPRNTTTSHTPTRPRHLRPQEWPWLALQLLTVCSVEVADDLFRGNVAHPDRARALLDARRIAAFELEHGLLIEPAWQHTLLQRGPMGDLPVSGSQVAAGADAIYAVAHLAVFALMFAWVYIYHRDRFPAVRAVAVLTSLISVVGYEVFPAAPPRLLGAVALGHRTVKFGSTVGGLIGGGTLHGTHIGYNQFSAMPSLHVAWALIVAGAVVGFSRRPIPRLLAPLYVVVMVVTVVVTGNHFVLDAAGAVAAVLAASMLVLAAGWIRDLQRNRERGPVVEPVPLSRSA